MKFILEKRKPGRPMNPETIVKRCKFVFDYFPDGYQLMKAYIKEKKGLDIEAVFDEKTISILKGL